MKLIQDTCQRWTLHDQHFWRRFPPSLFWLDWHHRHLNGKRSQPSHALSLWDCTWHCAPWQRWPSQLQTGSPLCPNTQWVPPWLPGSHCQEAQALHTVESPAPFCCSVPAPHSQTLGNLATAKNLPSPCCRPSEKLQSHKIVLHAPCDILFRKPSSALQKESNRKMGNLKHLLFWTWKSIVKNRKSNNMFCGNSSLQPTGSMSTWLAMRHSPTNRASQWGHQRCQSQSWSRNPALGRSSWCRPGAGRVIRDQVGLRNWLVTTMPCFFARRCLLELLHSCQPGFRSKLSNLLSFPHLDPECCTAGNENGKQAQ